MMKRLGLLLVALAGLGGFAAAQKVNEVGSSLAGFGGIDVYSDSGSIADSDAQDAENVLTDQGRLDKREGNVRISTTPLAVVSAATQPVIFVAEFLDRQKTRWLITQMSSQVYATDLGAAPTVIATATAGYPLSSVTAFGRKYFSNGFDTPFYWDGVSSGTVSGMPRCKFIGFADERLYCANTAASTSRVEVSSFGSVSYWTVPTDPDVFTADSPTYFDFQRDDGEELSCFFVTPWGKWAAKPHSSHVIKSYGSDGYLRLVSPTVGCIDNRTVQMLDGLLIWAAIDGVYTWDGDGAPKLASKEIESLYKSIQQLTGRDNSWTVTTAEDFNQGNLQSDLSPGQLSVTAIDGSITLAISSQTDTAAADFSAGTLAGVSVEAVGRVTVDYSTVPAANYDNFSTGVCSSSHTYNQWSYSTNIWLATPLSCTQRDFRGGPPVSGVYINYGAWTVAYTTDFPKGNFVCFSCAIQPSSGMDAVYTQNQQKPYCGLGWSNSHQSNLSVPVANRGSNYGYGLKVYQVADSIRVILSSFTTNPGAGATVVASADTAFTIASTHTYCAFRVPSTGVWTVQIDSQTVASSASGSFDYGDWTYLGLDVWQAYGTQISTYALSAIDNVKYIDWNDTGSIVSRTFDTGVASPVYGAVAIDYSSTTAQPLTFETQSSANGSAWEAAAALTPGSYPASTAQRYLRYKATWPSATNNNQWAYLNEVTLTAKSSACYRSEVRYIPGALSGWRSFDAEDTSTGGAVVYSVRVGTYAYALNASVPSWTSQTNHTDVSLSTGTGLYYQWRACFPESTPGTPSAVSNVRTNWREGASLPMASAVLSHRYFLSVQLSSASTANDKVLVWQRNKKWMKFAGPSYASMAVFDNNVVAGTGGTDGAVWKTLQPGVYRDDTAAIAAYWVSKDFNWQAPNQRKALEQVWVDAQPETATTLAVGYAADRDTTYISTTTSLTASTTSVNSLVPLVDGYALGKYFRFKLSNSTIDQGFRLNGYQVYAEIKERTLE